MSLPPKVHRKGPSLYYVHRGKWTRLCAVDAPENELNSALWKLQRRGLDSLSAVMDSYLKHRLPKRAMSTQKEYGRVIETRLRPVFGKMHPEDVTSQDIAVYLEKRDRAGHGISGNREISVLSSVFSHAMRQRACNVNPCYGVRRNEEKSRTYYIEDAELRKALRGATRALRELMWAAYLTGFRQGDLRRMTKDQVRPDGILVRQGKDGKHELRLWTDSLRKVVRRALKRSNCERVFTNSYGCAWTKNSIGLAMRRMKAETGVSFRFHDLRAKADSDSESGLGLMRRYNRARRLRAVK